LKVKIRFTETAQQNADAYYQRAKKLAQKKEGAMKAIKELKARLESQRKEREKDFAREQKENMPVVKQKKEWYEKFHWSLARNGMLVIGGRDAHQNELINAKHFEDNDLFFHADIFGASVVILKDGSGADKDTREEVAQFAACYSSAWKDNLHTVDVYAMRRDQVSKSKSKGTLGTGSFLLSGEREWYRNMSLELVMYVNEGRLITESMLAYMRRDERGRVSPSARVTQGKEKKSDAAKMVSKVLAYDDLDSIMQQLPTGAFRIVGK
jgi:predicted ribosome quality control (RQC) complex YloA/Tae2 family protein